MNAQKQKRLARQGNNILLEGGNCLLRSIKFVNSHRRHRDVMKSFTSVRYLDSSTLFVIFTHHPRPPHERELFCP